MNTTSRWGNGHANFEAQPFQKEDLLVVGLGLIVGLAQTTTNHINVVLSLAKMHANAKRDANEFAGSVESGLDSLLTRGDQ